MSRQQHRRTTPKTHRLHTWLHIFLLGLLSVTIAFAQSSPPPLLDADGDGLSDSDEALYGTDPHNPDTDNDGVTDWAELFYWQGQHRKKVIPLELPECDQDALIVDPGYHCPMIGGCTWNTARMGFGTPTLSEEIKSHRVVCFQPGDYTELGILRLDTTDFSTRVMRHAHNIPKDENPINASLGMRATLLALNITPGHAGNDGPIDFVVSSLSFSGRRFVENSYADPESSDRNQALITLDTGDHMRPVFDRLLLEDATARGIMLQHSDEGVVVQKSVFHRSWPGAFFDPSTVPSDRSEDYPCLSISKPSRNARVLNNEFADCAGDAIIAAHAKAWARAPSGHSGLTISGNDFTYTGFLGAWVDWPEKENDRRQYEDREGTWLNAQAARDWLDAGPGAPEPFWEVGNSQCAENAIDLKSTMPEEYYDDVLDSFRTVSHRGVRTFDELAAIYEKGLLPEEMLDPAAGIWVPTFDPVLEYKMTPESELDETDTYVNPAQFKIWVDDYVRAKKRAIEVITVPPADRAWIVDNRFHGTRGGRTARCTSVGDAPGTTSGSDPDDGSKWRAIVVHYPNSDYIRVADNIVFDSPTQFYSSVVTVHGIPAPLAIGQKCQDATDTLCKQQRYWLVDEAGEYILDENGDKIRIDPRDMFFYNGVTLPDHHEVVGNVVVNTGWEGLDFYTVYTGAFDFTLKDNVFKDTDLWSLWVPAFPQAIQCNYVVNSATEGTKSDISMQPLLDVYDNAYFSSDFNPPSTLIDRKIVYECPESGACNPFTEDHEAGFRMGAAVLTFDFPKWTTARQRSVFLPDVIPSSAPSEHCETWSFSIEADG